MKIFVTGGSSGVGLAVKNLLTGQGHEVTAPTRQELNLFDFYAIDGLDLGEYDVVVNCAGANPGAYLGWRGNPWHNQVTQVNVNFTAPLLLAKQYATQRDQGQFVFVTSTNIDDPIAMNIFYTASKAALRYSIDTFRKDCPGIVFTEICPGKIKSNMLRQNYQGTKTDEEIEAMYAKGPALAPEDLAATIDYAIKYKINQITQVPYDQS